MKKFLSKLFNIVADIMLRYLIILSGYLLSSIFFYMFYVVFNPDFPELASHFEKGSHDDTLSTRVLVTLYVFTLWNLSGFLYIAIVSPLIAVLKPNWAFPCLALIAIHTFGFFKNLFFVELTINELFFITCFLPAVISVVISLKLRMRPIF